MDSIKIPTRVEEAFNDPKWAEAMNIQMEALQKNNTWDIVDLPKGTKPDTFAPMAKINTIRVLTSLAVNLDWTLRQFDVKNAYLHGELEEEVYMSLPPWYSVSGDTGNVYRLKKALYELKQSPRTWFV
ncbi:unnamed protein product [Prunus armeniaca]